VALVTVLVPTHDHATTLSLAVRSVLDQTVDDLRVVIIGDGVGDDTRAVVQQLSASDDRVEFIDRPKQPRHAENLRAEVLSTADSPFVAYTGDDDLLLPHHLETMLGLLEGHDFTHPLPASVLLGPRLAVGPIDLGRRSARRSIRPPISRAAVSLTGVVHTLDSYRRLPFGWRTSPPDTYTDRYMWSQYLSAPGIRAVSGQRATTIKLAALRRDSMSPQERGREIEAWWTASHSAGFVTRWDAAVAAAVRRSRPRTLVHDALALALVLWPDDNPDTALARALGFRERRLREARRRASGAESNVLGEV
jgi:glycosyltransferase involved in cell wall biosynthesis